MRTIELHVETRRQMESLMRTAEIERQALERRQAELAEQQARADFAGQMCNEFLRGVQDGRGLTREETLALFFGPQAQAASDFLPTPTT